MHLTRRAALATMGATLCFPHVSRATESGQRTFNIIRDGDYMGYQTNRVSRIGELITHEAEVRIKVKVLGITAYRYEMDYVEEWRGGELHRLTSTCDDDGDDNYVKAARKGDVLEIDGSGFQGVQTTGVATTSYWAYPFLQRPTWISTQSGEPLRMNAAPAGSDVLRTATSEVKIDRWTLSGGYEAEALYVGDEWVGIKFDAGGETATYVPEDVSPQFMPVWNAA